MTAALLVTAGILIGVAVTAAISVVYHRRWAGEHEVRRWWTTETDIRAICQESDHNMRLARRVMGAANAADAIYREQVGDLLDEIARLRDRHRRPARHYRRYPLNYGTHRLETTR